MRRILIVGAGQSGLQLGHDLLGRGYEVTLMTGESSTDIRRPNPQIAQFTLPTALGHEQELGLDFWSGHAPPITGATVRLYPPSSKTLTVSGSFDGHATAVDRRVKMSDWLESFEDRGGKVVVHGCTVSDLDYLSRMFDLVIIAVGHGELGELFDVDPGRFGGARPRMLAQALIDDVQPGEESQSGYVEVGSAPELRVFLAPILTSGGACHALVIVEGDGGHISTWSGPRGTRRLEPAEQWNRMRGLLREYAPDLYARVKDAHLIDGDSTTVRKVQPQVHTPVGHLPSGGCVLGLADVVVSTDTIAGQGWNNSTRCATAYRARIVDHGDAPFTEAWMHDTFELFYSGTTQHHDLADTAHLDYAGAGQASALLSDTLDRLWDADAPAHLEAVLAAATTTPEVARRFIRGLDIPRDYTRWLYDPELAYAYLREVAQQST